MIMKRYLLFVAFIVVSMVAKAQLIGSVYQPVEPDYPRSTPTIPQTFSFEPFSGDFIGSVYQPVEPDYSRSTPIVRPKYNRSTGGLIGSVYVPVETQVSGKTFNATVLYESSTGHKATYKLPVVVHNGSVDKIIFNNNGGCVHIGINHSGYKYYGGKLKYLSDVNAYVTEVTIVNSNSWQKYTVVIE